MCVCIRCLNIRVTRTCQLPTTNTSTYVNGTSSTNIPILSSTRFLPLLLLSLVLQPLLVLFLILYSSLSLGLSLPISLFLSLFLSSLSSFVLCSLYCLLRQSIDLNTTSLLYCHNDKRNTQHSLISDTF